MSPSARAAPMPRPTWRSTPRWRGRSRPRSTRRWASTATSSSRSRATSPPWRWPRPTSPRRRPRPRRRPPDFCDPTRKTRRILSAANLRLAVSSVGAVALPLHPPCVLASLGFRSPDLRLALRPEPLTQDSLSEEVERALGLGYRFLAHRDRTE